MLLQQELSEESDIINATNNSGVPWAVDSYQLNYSGQTEYAINVSNFGKILFVTKETNNIYMPQLPVAFNDVSEQQYGLVFNWFNTAYNQSWFLSETPERMSFWRDGVVNPQYMVSIQPAPQGSAVYNIHYLPGYMGDDDPLESSIMMPEHAELVRLRGAMALLNEAKWYEDREANRVERKDRAAGYLYQLDRKEKLFAGYLGAINVPRMTEIEDWC